MSTAPRRPVPWVYVAIAAPAVVAVLILVATVVRSRPRRSPPPPAVVRAPVPPVARPLRPPGATLRKAAPIPPQSSPPPPPRTRPVAPPPAPAAPRPPIFTVGDVGRLVSPDGKRIPVASAEDDGAWDAMNEALLARDEEGFVRLVASGRVLVVPSGTGARVLDVGFVSRKVRLLDGPQRGKAAWVAAEYLAP
jgi:hypothetical protein